MNFFDKFKKKTTGYNPKPIKIDQSGEYSVEEYKDTSGLFSDFNFKLLVIDALLDLDADFILELSALEKKYVDNYDWYSDAPPIHEILLYLSQLQLSSDDLEKVTMLIFDAGNEIYAMIKPDWDGEDDMFDIVSIDGIEHLKNLKTIQYISMCDEEVLLSATKLGIEIV